MTAWKRVLVLAPHTDDGEFGRGATLARLVDGGTDVRYVAFTVTCRPLPEGFPPDTLARKCARRPPSPAFEERLDVHDFPEVRTFPSTASRSWSPGSGCGRNGLDAVLQPSLRDIHQDHQVVAAEGLRAFK